MNTQGLLNLLARAGVTELEARGGTIPDASQRWDRLLGRLNARFSGGAAPPSPDPLQGFDESLERSLMSPSPARRAPPARPAKRPAEAAAASRAVRPRLQEAPPGQGMALSGWGQRQARTQRAGPTALSWGDMHRALSASPDLSHSPGLCKRQRYRPGRRIWRTSG